MVELLEVVVDIVGETSLRVVAVVKADSKGELRRCLELRPLKQDKFKEVSRFLKNANIKVFQHFNVSFKKGQPKLTPLVSKATAV